MSKHQVSASAPNSKTGHTALLTFVVENRRRLGIQQRRLRRGASLFMPHDDVPQVFLIKSGRLRVYVPTLDGLDVFLSELGDGEIVGEISAVSGQRHATAVEAVEDTEVYAFSRVAFVSALHECPDFALEVMRSVHSLAKA